MWVQVSLDKGQSWIDICNFTFGTASATRVVNLSGLTPRTTPLVPSDGALGDDTAVDGILGSLIRARISSVGTYSNSFVAVRLDAR